MGKNTDLLGNEGCIVRNLIIILLVGNLGLVTGCASVKPLQPPAQAEGDFTAVVADRLPADNEKFSTSIPDSYFGVSGASGSLATGLLLGPIGVAANAAYVQSKNKENGAKVADLTSEDLGQILRTVVGAPSVEGHHGYELIPTGIVFFRDDNTYMLSCLINARYAASSTENQWQARYLVEAEGVYGVDDPSATAEAKATLRPCLEEAYALFRMHVTNQDGSYTVKKIRRATIDLKLPVQDQALPEQIIGNDGLGLIKFRKSESTSVSGS